MMMQTLITLTACTLQTTDSLMPYVEIWKNKPSWNNLPPDHRTRILQALTRLVQENAERTDGTCGPYLRCKEHDCLLIWDVRADRAESLKARYQRLLADYFEPQLFGSGEQLTAKDYADRL